jgi:hypothetical protein
VPFTDTTCALNVLPRSGVLSVYLIIDQSSQQEEVTPTQVVRVQCYPASAAQLLKQLGEGLGRYVSWPAVRANQSFEL